MSHCEKKIVHEEGCSVVDCVEKETKETLGKGAVALL
jgi:hypothetical protein